MRARHLNDIFTRPRGSINKIQMIDARHLRSFGDVKGDVFVLRTKDHNGIMFCKWIFLRGNEFN